MRTLVLEGARVPGYGFEVESQHVVGGMLEATKYGWDNGDKSGQRGNPRCRPTSIPSSDGDSIREQKTPVQRTRRSDAIAAHAPEYCDRIQCSHGNGRAPARGSCC